MKRLDHKRTVRFGNFTVRSFDSSVPVKLPLGQSVRGAGTKEDVAEGAAVRERSQFEIPEGILEKTTGVGITDWKNLAATVRQISVEKWWNPLHLISHGEIMKFTNQTNNTTWGFTWDYLYNLYNARITFLEVFQGCNSSLISKRGYTVAELLRRSPRTLDHQCYINSIVQHIYNQLTPRLRMKTDAEWLQRRIAIRKTFWGSLSAYQY